jgi:sugar-specific transcriptional regulator TrmB
MSIQKMLQNIGLSEKERKVYLLLLKRGRMKPTELAKAAKISRPLVYSIAKGLLSKGIISEDMSGKSLYFVALAPQSLEKLIQVEKRETERREALIQKAVAELNLIKSRDQYPVPKIRLVEEGDLEKYLFDNLTKWQDEVITTEDGIWWGFQDNSFVEEYRDWIRASWQTEQSDNPHYKARVFTNSSGSEESLQRRYPKSKREMYFLDQSKFTATTWVCGNYLIMIMIKEHPYYLLEIYDELMARNTAEIFRRLWEQT